MRFIIDDVEYPATSLERITGMDAIELVRQAGIGAQTTARLINEIPRLARDSAGSVIVLPEGEFGDGDLVTESEPHLRALLVLVWMSRRHAGNPTMTFADALGFAFSDLSIVLDDADVEADATESPDPTQPSDSAPEGSDGADPSPTTSTASTTLSSTYPGI